MSAGTTRGGVGAKEREMRLDKDNSLELIALPRDDLSQRTQKFAGLDELQQTTAN
jgi:hypothetical protein